MHPAHTHASLGSAMQTRVHVLRCTAALMGPKSTASPRQALPHVLQSTAWQQARTQALRAQVLLLLGDPLPEGTAADMSSQHRCSAPGFLVPEEPPAQQLPQNLCSAGQGQKQAYRFVCVPAQQLHGVVANPGMPSIRVFSGMHAFGAHCCCHPPSATSNVRPAAVQTSPVLCLSWPCSATQALMHGCCTALHCWVDKAQKQRLTCLTRYRAARCMQQTTTQALWAKLLLLCVPTGVHVEMFRAWMRSVMGALLTAVASTWRPAGQRHEQACTSVCEPAAAFMGL